MWIEDPSHDDLLRVLNEIHKRARAYDGPLARDFLQLARLSAPTTEEDDQQDVFLAPEHGATRQLEEKLAAALSFLIRVAFPANRETESGVRQELNQLLGRKDSIAAIRLVDDDLTFNIANNLPERPQESELQLLEALSRFLPRESEVWGEP